MVFLSDVASGWRGLQGTVVGQHATHRQAVQFVPLPFDDLIRFSAEHAVVR